MSKAQRAPFEQIEKLAFDLAQWLRGEGFAPGHPPGAPDDPSAAEKRAYRDSIHGIFYNADAARVQASKRANAVHAALAYLLGTALRAQHREVELAKRKADPETHEAVPIAFSPTKAELGRSVRTLIGPVEHIRGLVRKWESEQCRLVELGFPRTDEIRTAYDAFVRAGERLLAAIEPRGVDSGVLALPVPWTMDDWSEIAVELEVSLFAAGFTDPEIAVLFGRSSPELVTQARYRLNKSRT